MLEALAGTWISDTLIGELKYRNLGIDAVDPSAFTGLLGLIHNGVITDKSGIDVLRVMLDLHLNHQPAEKPFAIVDRLNLKKVSFTPGAAPESGAGCDPEINPVTQSIAEVLADNPGAIEDFRSGKKGAFNFLVGQVMKRTRGCADPAEVNRLLAEELTRKEV
jgi:aspartyl-tRNA(Asn)/glutamyl-tRNA(Gln) amidotransferase subunit B